MKRVVNYRFMNRASASTNGFTIVELLIVIVIIAILATITIIAYNGITDRANDAKTDTAVSTYDKLFKMYTATEGVLPVFADYNVALDRSNGDAVCLGPPDSYPATGDFESGECATWFNDIEGDYYGHFVDESFNDSFNSIVGSVPPAAYNTVTIASNPAGSTDVKYRGIIYRDDYEVYGESVYGSSSIHYFLKGTQQCAQGETHSYSGITECVIGLRGDSSGEWGKNGGEGW